MKTLKVRIDPDSEQRKAIDLNIEANRLVYNSYLTACRSHYLRTGNLPSVFDLNKIGTRARNNSPFIKQSYSLTLNETSKRALDACEKTLAVHTRSSGTLDMEKGFETAGPHFPRYRSRGQFGSYTYPSVRDFSIVIDKDDEGRRRRRLRLGKVPGLLRCYNQVTGIRGEIKTCTVSRKDMGRYRLYYASITYDDVSTKYPEPKGPIGVDIGISNIAALSDGTVFPNDHIYARKEKAFRKAHEQFSRSQHDPKRQSKLRTKLNHLYERMVNHRRNNIEKISSYIVKNHDTIVMEDLSVKQLRSVSRNRVMTKSYNDASPGILRRRIQDKAGSAGREIILVDPRGTSQICSCCGNIVKKDLSVRVHVCPECGYNADRDVNAARNILARASLPGLRGRPAILPGA